MPTYIVSVKQNMIPKGMFLTYAVPCTTYEFGSYIIAKYSPFCQCSDIIQNRCSKKNLCTFYILLLYFS